MGIEFRQRHDLGQHIADHDDSKRDRQVDQPEGGRRHGPREHRDGKPCLAVLRHRKAPVGQRQHAQPVGDMGHRVARDQQQQDVPRFQLSRAQLRGDLAALSRQAQQHRALTPRQAHRLRCAPVEPGAIGHHDLDNLDPVTIGQQEVFTVPVGQREVQRAAEFVQCIGRGLKHNRVSGLQHHVAGRAIAPLAVAHQAQDRHIGAMRLFLQLGQPFADLFVALGYG